MKKKNFIWLCTLFLMVLTGCSRDNEIEAESYDPEYQVKYYSQDPSLKKMQRRWYEDKEIILFPQEKPPYYLFVIWNNDEGKKALDYIVSKDDGVVIEKRDYGDGNRNWAYITTSKYISCPYLYISSSYKESNDFLREYEYVRIVNRIILKMKEGKSVEAIEKKYSHVLERDTTERVRGIEKFNCNLKTSCEIIQLTDEIHLRDDVEWAEPSMIAPIHFDI